MRHRKKQAEHPDYRRGERGPNGRPLCRRCLNECPGRRTSFCSDTCVRDFLIAKGNGSDCRLYVFERDGGICALCGLDCEKLQRHLSRIAYLACNRDRAHYRQCALRFMWLSGWNFYSSQIPPAGGFLEPDWNNSSLLQWAHPQQIIYMALLFRTGFSQRFIESPVKSLWQADHTVPLIEGGAGHIDNLRTLCVPCHHRATADLAGRRKKPPAQLSAGSQ